MLNRLYAAGIAYLALCGFAIANARPKFVEAERSPEHGGSTPPRVVPGGSTAQGWFASVKPFCNAVEVETALRQSPAPLGMEGTGFEAACLALSGKVDRARERIERLAGDDRWRAAGIVFEVAHPVADAGDDRSAGPIMAMVVDFWPNHYMALYHAGMSEFALGDRGKARSHLESFLQYYAPEDGWRSSAKRTLEQLGQ